MVDDGGRPVGVLTERDIVRLSNDQVPTEQLTLYEAMHAPVITIRPRKTLHSAVKSMEDARIRRLVVTDDKGVACGLLTHHEVARGLEGDYVAYLKEMCALQAGTQAQAAPAIDEGLLLANILRGMNGAAALATDLDWRICYASPAVAKLLGPSVENMAGSDLRDALLAIGWKDAAASLAQAVAGPGPGITRCRPPPGRWPSSCRCCSTSSWTPRATCCWPHCPHPQKIAKAIF